MGHVSCGTRQRDRAYGEPADRASFSHTRLMHSPALHCIALHAYKGGIAAFAHCPSHVNCCRHTFVRLLSIGKIVRSNSNCQRSTLKRHTTAGQIDRRGVSLLCACSSKTRMRDRLHAHESWLSLFSPRISRTQSFQEKRPI